MSVRIRSFVLLAPLLSFACGEEVFEVPEPPPVGLQVHLQPIVIEPGTDVEFCTYFNLDLETEVQARGEKFLLKNLISNGIDPLADELAIGKIEVRGAPGLHHIQILAMENDLEDVEDRHIFECAVDLFGGPLTGDVDPLFFTSLNELSVTYPQGVARVLKRVPDRMDETKTRGTQLLYNFHYLNTTEKQIQAEVVVNLHVVPRETVVHPVRSAWWNYIYFKAAPKAVSKVEAKGSFLVDVNLVGMTSHQHETGKRFTYSRGGKQIYESKDWTEPKYLEFPVGTVMTKGEELRFSCEWDNPHTAARYFGLQANDEMCTAIIEYYPVDEVAAEALLASQRAANEMSSGPFDGELVTLERFFGFPEELIDQISAEPDRAFEILDHDIVCGIAINLKQMERQYGSSAEILTSLQGLLSYLEPICGL